MSQRFAIPVVPPYPWEAILRYLSLRSTPGVETASDGRYVRQTPCGSVSVTYDATTHVLEVEAADGIADLRPRLERLFDTRHDPEPATRVLARSPIFRQRMKRVPGVRVPGCWDPFELCLRVILGQQVTVKAAHTLMGRLAVCCPSLTAADLAATDLSTFGLPAKRKETLVTIAERVAAGEIRFDGVRWPEIAARLASVPGFGPWTLGYLGIRLGRDPDAFPSQDLGLLRATGAGSPKELEKLAERWHPYRGYAAMYLWMVE